MNGIATLPFPNLATSNVFQEVDLDYNMIITCRKLHKGRSCWIGAIGRMLRDEILAQFLEIWKDGVRMRALARFDRIIKDHWIPFCESVLEWVWCVGIVVFRLKTLEDGEIVPAVVEGVPGQHYRITTWYDPSRDSQRFSYYRLISRENKLIQATADPDVMILYDLDYNPSYDGAINSIVSSLIPTEIFMNRQALYMLRAENSKSKPMILTETTKDSVGAFDSSMGIGRYGGLNMELTDKHTKFRKNDAEITETIRHSQNFINQIIDANQSLIRSDPTIIDYTEPQIKNNMMPLPTNHKMVSQIMPQSRNDWASMKRVYQEEIFAAYTLPTQVLLTDGSAKNMGSSDLAQKRLDKTVNKWRTILSNTLTDIYSQIYGDEDSIDEISEGGKMFSDPLDDNQIAEVIEKSRITLVFPHSLTISPSELLQQFSMGIINYEQFVAYSWRNSGYNLTEMQNNETKKDPWDYEAKLSILRQSKLSAALKATGSAGEMILETQEEKEKKKEKKEGEKKKKEGKKEVKRDEKKKKKRRREASDDDSDE